MAAGFILLEQVLSSRGYVAIQFFSLSGLNTHLFTEPSNHTNERPRPSTMRKHARIFS